MKKKNIVWIVATLLVAGGAAWYLGQGLGGDAAHAAASQEAGKDGGKGGGKGKGGAQGGPVTVNAVAPLRQDVPVMLQANGSVMAASTVDLHPQITSTIRKVHIREGQFVKAGALMFTLDDRSGRANIDKAQAQLARDQAALADVERQYKRSSELFAQQFIAQSAVDTLRSQLESARALVQASQAALQSEKVNTSYTVIQAPMAGRVGAIAVFPGSLVQNATSLTTITQVDPIDVGFTLPESALADLMAAQNKGKVAVEATSSTGAAPQTGVLTFIDNTVDPLAGTIKVKARFDNKEHALWPGQYATVRITVQTIKDAVVVPQVAIINNTKGTFVYVVDADQSARMAPVKRVHSFGLNAVVTGLDGSEKVITEGKQNLRPGAKVRLAEAAGDGAGGAAREGKRGAKKEAAQ
jgi:multidrug efflux system membrane fusion protein